MKRLIKYISAMILCLLMCLTGPGRQIALAQAAPEDPIVSLEGLRVEILWGDHSLVRVGREIPVTVRLTSSGAEVTGMARAMVPIGDGEYYALEEAVSVAAGETRQVVFSVPVTYDTDTIWVEFQGEHGAIYGARQINLRTEQGDQEVYVAVISSDVGQLAAFDRVVLNEYRGTVTRLFDFKEDTLPTDANVLKLYDIFLWDDVSLDQVSEEQREALNRWVYGGGILIMGADSDSPMVLTDKETRTVAEEMGFRREAWGRGLYVYGDFSLREISVKYPQENGVRQFLYEAVGQSRMEAMEETMGDAYEDYWIASSMTSGVDAERIPQVWQYAVMLIIYLILLGPVLYGILKKKKRRNLLRVAMIGLALVFTAIIYIMGSGTRFYRPVMHYATVQEIRSGTMMETVYANVFSPSNAAYTMEFEDKYDVIPLVGYSYGSERQTNREICQMKIRQKEQGTEVWIRGDTPFTTNMLRLTGTEKSPYGEGFLGQITLFEDGWAGTLQNATGQDFEQVCVLAGGRVVLVGEMPAGSQVDLAQLPIWLLYGSDQNHILEAMAGKDKHSTPGESEASSKAAWRHRVLTSYFQNQMLDENGTALVLGFPVVEQGGYLQGDTVEVQGVTLVTEVISLHNEKQGLHYQTMNRESIQVLQGSYNDKRNSTTEKLCVLRYDFGALDVERLLVCWPASMAEGEYRKVFDQPLEFYHVENGQYESVGRQTMYDRQALAPYLDEENGLTVRYHLSTSEEAYYEVFLPDLSVVGRKVR